MQKGFQTVNLHGCASGVIATPVIGESGNWFIGNDDTGISAKGDKGDTGAPGETGPQGPKGETPELAANLVTEEEGYALDATMGKVLDEKIGELNSKLTWKLLSKGSNHGPNNPIILPENFCELYVLAAGYSFYFPRECLTNAGISIKNGSACMSSGGTISTFERCSIRASLREIYVAEFYATVNQNINVAAPVNNPESQAIAVYYR